MAAEQNHRAVLAENRRSPGGHQRRIPVALDAPQQIIGLDPPAVGHVDAIARREQPLERTPPPAARAAALVVAGIVAANPALDALAVVRDGSCLCGGGFGHEPRWSELSGWSSERRLVLHDDRRGVERRTGGQGLARVRTLGAHEHSVVPEYRTENHGLHIPVKGRRGADNRDRRCVKRSWSSKADDADFIARGHRRA